MSILHVEEKTMTVQTCAGLKQTARGILLGKYQTAVLLVLAVSLFNNILLLFNGMSAVNGNLLLLLTQFLVSLIIHLFNGILTVGVSAFYLNIACNRSYRFSDLFIGFKLYPEKALGVQFFTWLFGTIPLIPAYILFSSIMLDFSIENMLSRLGLFLILYLTGYLLSVLITCTYSQCFYLLLDFPEMSLRQLMQISRRLMKGHRLRLFYTRLSFFPLILAGVFSFGIGLLFVTPYQDMTYTLFYLDLLQTKRYNNSH